MTRAKIVGVLLGFIGVLLFTAVGLFSGEIPLDIVMLHGFGVVCLSVGLVIQRRIRADISLIESASCQYISATVAFMVLAYTIESPEIDFTLSFIVSFLWLVFVLSLGAVLVLMFLLSKEEVSKISSLFFMMPAVASVISAFIIGESLTLLQVSGLLVSAIGVAIVLHSGTTVATYRRWFKLKTAD